MSPGARADAVVARSSVASQPVQQHALKPYSAMPGPRGYPLIGSLWDYLKKDGYKFNKMFEVRFIGFIVCREYSLPF